MYIMFECDNQDSCLLYSYLNGGQGEICETNKHGQMRCFLHRKIPNAGD